MSHVRAGSLIARAGSRLRPLDLTLARYYVLQRVDIIRVTPGM
jgi:hypothetical protein